MCIGLYYIESKTSLYVITYFINFGLIAYKHGSNIQIFVKLYKCSIMPILDYTSDIYFR